jgi:hypothetical protein
MPAACLGTFTTGQAQLPWALLLPLWATDMQDYQRHHLYITMECWERNSLGHLPPAKSVAPQTHLLQDWVQQHRLL